MPAVVPIIFGLVALGILFGPSAYASSTTEGPNCAYRLKGPAIIVENNTLVFLDAECAEQMWDSQAVSDDNPLRSFALWAVLLKSGALAPGDGLRLPQASEFASRPHMLAFMMLWDRMIKAHQQIGRFAEEGGGEGDWQQALALYGATPNEIAALPVELRG